MDGQDRKTLALLALSQVGPLRFAHSPSRPFNLAAGRAEKIAGNGGHSGPSLVRVQADPTQAAGPTRFGRGPSLSRQASVTVDLQAGTFEEILLEGEELYAQSPVATSVVVTEVALP